MCDQHCILMLKSLVDGGRELFVFKATFNSISAISWRSILLLLMLLSCYYLKGYMDWASIQLVGVLVPVLAYDGVDSKIDPSRLKQIRDLSMYIYNANHTSWIIRREKTCYHETTIIYLNGATWLIVSVNIINVSPK